MTLTKCPRCELNSITDGEKFCKICRLEMKGEPVRDEIEMCTMCGEHPAMPGKDVCLFCMKEMNGGDDNGPEDDGDVAVMTEDAAMGIDPLSTMDEIIPEAEGDEEGAMSLEALGEEEEENDDLDEDDDLDDGMGGKRRR